MFFRSRSKVEQAVKDFLQRSGLAERVYTEEEFIEGLRTAGYDIVCEAFTHTGTLRACLMRIEDTTVLFYPRVPDFFATLHNLAHEVGHLVLGHPLSEIEEAVGENVFSNPLAWEAELFARLVIEHRARIQETAEKGPRALDNYLRRLNG